jgi:hypothetical protein
MNADVPLVFLTASKGFIWRSVQCESFENDVIFNHCGSLFVL